MKPGSVPPQRDPVPALQRLLGLAVFISWPKGTKGSAKRWRFLTLSHMTPVYLAGLKNGNIGVALGDVSGGLCVIDWDDERFVEPFLALNPEFRDTFQTHGKRGRSFWFRAGVGLRSRKLKTGAGEDAGEFRANGNQSIVWGIHPDTHRHYQWLVSKPTLEIELSSVRWPDEIAEPRCIEEPDEQEESGRAAGRSGSSRASIPSVSSLSSSPSGSSDSSLSSIHSDWSCEIRNEEDVLRRCVANRSHSNNRLLFDLARGVKALEQLQDSPFAQEQLRSLFDQWHAGSSQFLRAEQSKEDYWIEFLAACASAKYPLGGVAVSKAWQSAQNNPLPPEAEQFENPQLRLLVGLCRELQVLNGDDPFWISCYTCQRLFAHENHTTAAKWLRSLRTLRIIELVEKGNARRASRYRYSSPRAPEEGKGE